MAQLVKDVMTTDVVACDASAPIVEAARLMRDRGIGDVLVKEGKQLRGIVTDRDIVVRGIAEGRDVLRATLADVCSNDIVCATPETPVDEAAQMMRDRAIRRLPVCRGDEPVGVVTLGDLAMESDPNSALADISAARPNA
jgi:CBS domain-containing protein